MSTWQERLRAAADGLYGKGSCGAEFEAADLDNYRDMDPEAAVRAIVEAYRDDQCKEHGCARWRCAEQHAAIGGAS